MATYAELGAVVTMREAAGLTGVSRATAHRHDTAAEATRSSVRPAPANRLTRHHVAAGSTTTTAGQLRTASHSAISPD